MSSSIWTRCAGDSELRALRCSPWRVVEAQHRVSTRSLVDSAEEQALLENLIDGVKPPDRTGGTLHYLLFTPFRYPPLRHGSRFGGRHEPGIWYGSEHQRTAFAEVAYYRLLFLEGTQADLGDVATQLTAFTVVMRSSRAIDLTVAPFNAHHGAISSRTSYRSSQSLGGAMREAGVELFRFSSARDAEGGVNVAAFDARVFGRANPKALRTWHCVASRARVEVTSGDYFRRESWTFPREQFVVHGELPSPAL